MVIQGEFEIVVSAKELDESNMVFDFQAFKAAFGDYLDSLDHAMYINMNCEHYKYFSENFEKTIGFDGDPTTEAVVKVMFDYFDKVLKPGNIITGKKDFKYIIKNEIRLERVRLWETRSSWAEFSRD